MTDRTRIVATGLVALAVALLLGAWGYGRLTSDVHASAVRLGIAK